MPHANALVCVVADGAGSASKAEEGASLTCDIVVEQAQSVGIVDLHSREFALNTLAKIKESINNCANLCGLRSRDFACTLLVAIVGLTEVSFWQLGDGAICFRVRPEESFSYAFWPAKGEFANVTEFVTDDNAEQELQFDSGELQIADLALFSDGLERLALEFDTGEVHSEFFMSLFPYLYRRTEGHLLDLEEQMRNFLASERINARTDDDKTLILATRESDAA